MDHFFTRNSVGRVFGFLEVNSVWKKWKIYPNFKIPEIFGFLDLGLSLEPDTWFYLFGHGISQTQPMWGHTRNFSSFGPLILHLPGGGWISPPPHSNVKLGPPHYRVKTLLRHYAQQALTNCVTDDLFYSTSLIESTNLHDTLLFIPVNTENAGAVSPWSIFSLVGSRCWVHSESAIVGHLSSAE